MENEGADYEAVLKRAQEIGYAERNPSADVEGHDSCRKIAILSSLMLGKTVDYRHIHTEGITQLTLSDMQYAKAAGLKIKLLAMSRLENELLYAIVAPFLIPAGHPLTMVNDVFNAVFVKGNMLGDSMYYGQGAGKLPTASAVVSDVIDCARHIGKSIVCFWEEEPAALGEIAEVSRRFFLRGDSGSKEQILQAFPGGTFLEIPQRTEDFGYFTQTMPEKEFYHLCEKLDGAVRSSIRLLS
jgi:homoserine dehydrogenase